LSILRHVWWIHLYEDIEIGKGFYREEDRPDLHRCIKRDFVEKSRVYVLFLRARVYAEVMRRHLRNDNGFTLVEAMIALGIMAVGMLAITSMMESNSKANRNATQQSDAQNLANLIQMDLNVGAACNATILAIPSTLLTFPFPASPTLTIPVTKVLTGTVPPQPIAAVDQVINSVKLSGPSSLSLQNFLQTGPSNFAANLVINATAMSSTAVGSSLGTQNFIRNVPVSLLVTINALAGTATITGCSSSGGTMMVQKSALGGCTSNCYVSGTTYTNTNSYAVLEEVRADMTHSSGTGGGFELSSIISGPPAKIMNDCNPGAVGISFVVPPGATFSSTAVQVEGGCSGNTFLITSWLELSGF
jgi:prepilin-type N-terminal cleavage/methylation domain-containing protein